MSDMLRTYLQDHHAGSTVGVELAKRAAGSNEDSPYGPEIAAIAAEIAADKETLEQVMERLGVKSNPVKDGLGWTAEKLGRLKPNNSLTGYSPLSRVVELEGLVIGVTGKLGLWKSLRDAIGETLDGVSFTELIERAQNQISRLDAMRLKASGEAFRTD